MKAGFRNGSKIGCGFVPIQEIKTKRSGLLADGNQQLLNRFIYGSG